MRQRKIMPRKHGKIVALSGLAFVFLLLPAYTFAFPGIGGDPLIPCGLQGQDPCNFCHAFQLIQNIYNFIIFVIAPPIAVALVAVGAFFWLSAAGSEGQITKGRKILVSVVWGLVAVYVSWLLVSFVITLIAAKPVGNEPVPYNPAKWFDPTNWFDSTRLHCSAGGGGVTSTANPPGGGSNNVITSRVSDVIDFNAEIGCELALEKQHSFLTAHAAGNVTSNLFKFTFICSQDKGAKCIENFMDNRYPGLQVTPTGNFSLSDCKRITREIQCALDNSDSDYVDVLKKVPIVLADSNISYRFNEEYRKWQEDNGILYKGPAEGLYDSFSNIILINSSSMACSHYIHEFAHARAQSKYGSILGNSGWVSLYQAVGDEPNSWPEKGFVNYYATINESEDIASTVQVAIESMISSGSNGPYSYFDGAKGREILYKKYKYLYDDGFLPMMPNEPSSN